MKRDMDLIRTILLQIEEAPPNVNRIKLKLDGPSQDEVTEHLRLLIESGLIEAIPFQSNGKERFLPKRLTWKGHEFLDAARNDRAIASHLTAK
jgi:SOS-response transcriptional repressor LexA